MVSPRVRGDVVSGGMLFAGFATSAYTNVYFRVQVVATLLAGVNAVAFNLLTQRSSNGWDAMPSPPPGVRLAEVVSIAVWCTVILAGK